MFCWASPTTSAMWVLYAGGGALFLPPSMELMAAWRNLQSERFASAEFHTQWIWTPSFLVYKYKLPFMAINLLHGKLSRASRSIRPATVVNPPRSRDRLYSDHMSTTVHRRSGELMLIRGFPVLFSIASLTFPLNQMPSLAKILTPLMAVTWPQRINNWRSEWDAHEISPCRKFNSLKGNLNWYNGVTESTNNFHAVNFLMILFRLLY